MVTKSQFFPTAAMHGMLGQRGR